MAPLFRKLIWGTALLLAASLRAQVPATAFVNFEARQTNPVRLSPNRQLLFAVNSADARLSVFNVTQTPPLLVKEIPVGIEPVSVNARTNDEVWVVNELSDSVSIVSVSRGIVIDTINVKDEPPMWSSLLDAPLSASPAITKSALTTCSLISSKKIDRHTRFRFKFPEHLTRGCDVADLIQPLETIDTTLGIDGASALPHALREVLYQLR